MDELVSSVLSVARALAHEYGAALAFPLEAQPQAAEAETGRRASGGRCLCDRTLARQALSRFAGRLGVLPAGADCPSRWCAARGHAHPGPALRLATAAPVDLSAGERAHPELERARAFMAAQEGELELLEPEGPRCRGVELIFRAESRARVLLVDDNEKLLQLYTRYLRLGSYETRTAGSAADAEACAGAGRRRRHHSGRDDARGGRLGAVGETAGPPGRARVPVIVCSVLDEPKLASLLGAQAYLKKPVVADDLLAALASVLG